MSKIEEIVAELRAISARVNDGSAVSVFAGQSQGLSLAAAIVEKQGAALDGEWQSERPSEGSWYMSLPPHARDARWNPVEFVLVDKEGSVWSDSPGLDGGHIAYLSNPLFTGALWQRRTVPGDPFARLPQQPDDPRRHTDGCPAVYGTSQSTTECAAWCKARQGGGG